MERVREGRVVQRVAVALSFVFLAALAGLFVYSLIMADEARDEAPDLRNDIERAVAQAVFQRSLDPDAMRLDPIVTAQGGPAPARFPEVVGAELRSHAMAYDVDGVLTFTYAGTMRAPGYCFPGSVRGDRVRVEFHRC